MDQDREQVRMLRIFQYVYAGMIALVALFPLIYVAFGAAIVGGAIPMGPSTPGSPPPPLFVGWILVAIGLVITAIFESFAVLNFFAARFLGEFRGRTFCMVIAVIDCFNMPLGTLLGVFTLVVLSRPGVKALFDAVEQGSY